MTEFYSPDKNQIHWSSRRAVCLQQSLKSGLNQSVIIHQFFTMRGRKNYVPVMCLLFTMNQGFMCSNMSSVYKSMATGGFHRISDPINKPTQKSSIFLPETLPSGKIHSHDVGMTLMTDIKPEGYRHMVTLHNHTLTNQIANAGMNPGDLELLELYEIPTNGLDHHDMLSFINHISKKQNNTFFVTLRQHIYYNIVLKLVMVKISLHRLEMVKTSVLFIRRRQVIATLKQSILRIEVCHRKCSYPKCIHRSIEEW